MSVLVPLLRQGVSAMRRLGLTLSCSLTGQQHPLLVYLWSLLKKRSRDRTFNNTGYLKVRLLESAEWRSLSVLVDAQIREYGAVRRSEVEWAENRRIYLDCETLPGLEIARRLHDAESFKRSLDAILGRDNWRIFSTQVWRNQAEKYGSSSREINSTYYHVDNGGPAAHRLLINMFMYLSEVREKNGPLIYYDPAATRKINRRFLSKLVRRGNLRSFDLVQKIESYIRPSVLSLDPGEAIFIDNQICLHRAGFCSEGHRDIVEILVMQKR